MLVESAPKSRQVQVAVDAAELLIGFEHPCGTAIVPSRQRLTFLECSRQISITDSMGLVERSVGEAQS